MQYISHYCSPIGGILLAADDIGLTGVWFEGQKYFALSLDKEHEEKELPLFEKAKQWLDIYFSGKEPDFTLPLHFTGTAFQNEVWEILCTIPYGHTMTYGEIAKQVAAGKGLPHMSAQAVGGAVGRRWTETEVSACCLSWARQTSRAVLSPAPLMATASALWAQTAV